MFCPSLRRFSNVVRAFFEASQMIKRNSKMLFVFCVFFSLSGHLSQAVPSDITHAGSIVLNGVKRTYLLYPALILYAVEGGGHTWPGGYQYLDERIVGKTSRDMDVNEVIWVFLKKQRAQ